MAAIYRAMFNKEALHNANQSEISTQPLWELCISDPPGGTGWTDDSVLAKQIELPDTAHHCQELATRFMAQNLQQ